jgi:SAM-dependent methyltransferase
MPDMYDAFARFYDLEYGLKDDDIAFYLDIADQYGSPILEIGVGTGRIAMALAQAGFTVWGIDNSAPMLKKAARKRDRLASPLRKRVVLKQNDMRAFRLRKSFRCAIIPFRAFLHNLSVQEQLATLRGIHRHVQPGGILALDLFVPIYHVLCKTEWKLEIPEEDLAEGYSGVSITSTVKHDPVRQLLQIQNVYHEKKRERKATMIYRYVFRYEMEALLIAAGFELLWCGSGFKNEPYDFHSGVMTLIARKTRME